MKLLRRRIRYHIGQMSGRRRRMLNFGVFVACALAILIIATIVIYHIYDVNLEAPSTSQKSQIVIIKSGESVNAIADQLHNARLIKSAWSFEWYVRAQGVRGNLEAGTYSFTPSQDVESIVSTLTQGRVATKLVTILPGQRLDQIRSTLINDGFTPASVDAALQPGQYASLPALADKPAGANLEGLLYPDSFQKDANTNPKQIISESLQEMGNHLTPSLQAAFASEGLTTYQGIILASIVEQEVSKPSDQAQAAQVFLSRLKANMPLGSDVTAYYGSIVAGQAPSLTYDSPYNTLIHTGLPPTPISNVNEQALNAVAHPANTNWLYFVTGDNGTTYFETTAQQHQQDTINYCHKLCSQ